MLFYPLRVTSVADRHDALLMSLLSLLHLYLPRALCFFIAKEYSVDVYSCGSVSELKRFLSHLPVAGVGCDEEISASYTRLYLPMPSTLAVFSVHREWFTHLHSLLEI